MNNEKNCQSCGRKLEVGLYGTETNGDISSIYCKLCYDHGEFREPNLTIDEITGRMAANLIDEQHMERPAAERIATSTIPTLGRWRKS